MIAWQRDLEGAVSVREIVELTRGYIASMPREEFAQLPEDCRPSFIANADDVRAWSGRINDAYWRSRAGERPSTAALQEIWSFLLRVSTRLARVAEERPVSS